MSGRSYEKETSVNTEIRFLTTLGLLFLSHVNLVLIIDEIDNRCPGIAVVDVVPEAGCVDDGELDLERLLLQLGLDNIDLCHRGCT